MKPFLTSLLSFNKLWLQGQNHPWVFPTSTPTNPVILSSTYCIVQILQWLDKKTKQNNNVVFVLLSTFSCFSQLGLIPKTTDCCLKTGNEYVLPKKKLNSFTEMFTKTRLVWTHLSCGIIRIATGWCLASAAEHHTLNSLPCRGYLRFYVDLIHLFISF